MDASICIFVCVEMSMLVAQMHGLFLQVYVFVLASTHVCVLHTDPGLFFTNCERRGMHSPPAFIGQCWFICE